MKRPCSINHKATQTKSNTNLHESLYKPTVCLFLLLAVPRRWFWGCLIFSMVLWWKTTEPYCGLGTTCWICVVILLGMGEIVASLGVYLCFHELWFQIIPLFLLVPKAGRNLDCDTPWTIFSSFYIQWTITESCSFFFFFFSYMLSANF